MDKPIPEAVRALLAELDEYLRGCPNPETTWPVWMIRKPSRLLWRCREAICALTTAAQQQGQAAAPPSAPVGVPPALTSEQAHELAPAGFSWDEAGAWAMGYEACRQRALAQQPAAGAQARGGGDRRDREADRARFSDAAFNDWLDTGISDAGHTVWDMVGDLADAWAGWEARQFAGDAVLLTECCSREECGGECGNEWRGMAMYRKPSDDLAAPPSAPVGVEGAVRAFWHGYNRAAVGVGGRQQGRTAAGVAAVLALAQQPAAVDGAMVMVQKHDALILADFAKAHGGAMEQLAARRITSLAAQSGGGAS